MSHLQGFTEGFKHGYVTIKNAIMVHQKMSLVRQDKDGKKVK